MKAILYARISSERQAEKDLSIASQLKALRKYAGDRGWEITKEYVDEAESARTANRPLFIEMIGHAMKHYKEVDPILVWLGNGAPEGLSLHSLRIFEFDPGYGGRWNAGSNRRAGGTHIGLEDYALEVSRRLNQ